MCHWSSHRYKQRLGTGTHPLVLSGPTRHLPTSASATGLEAEVVGQSTAATNRTVDERAMERGRRGVGLGACADAARLRP